MDLIVRLEGLELTSLDLLIEIVFVLQKGLNVSIRLVTLSFGVQIGFVILSESVLVLVTF